MSPMAKMLEHPFTLLNSSTNTLRPRPMLSFGNPGASLAITPEAHTTVAAGMVSPLASITCLVHIIFYCSIQNDLYAKFLEHFICFFL